MKRKQLSGGTSLPSKVIPRPKKTFGFCRHKDIKINREDGHAKLIVGGTLVFRQSQRGSCIAPEYSLNLVLGKLSNLSCFSQR